MITLSTLQFQYGSECYEYCMFPELCFFLGHSFASKSLFALSLQLNPYCGNSFSSESLFELSPYLNFWRPTCIALFAISQILPAYTYPFPSHVTKNFLKWRVSAIYCSHQSPHPLAAGGQTAPQTLGVNLWVGEGGLLLREMGRVRGKSYNGRFSKMHNSSFYFSRIIVTTFLLKQLNMWQY